MQNKNINYLLFFLLAAFWGGSFAAIKEAVSVAPPFFSAMLRVGLGLFFLVLLILCYLKKNVSVPFSLRWRLWVTGLFSQGIPFFFLFWGEQHISSGLAGILNGTVPIWTTLFSLVSAKTRDVSLLKGIGLAVGLLGVLVIFWPMLHFNFTPIYLLGTLSVLLMAISYSIGNLLNQHLLSGSKAKLDFYANIYHQLCASLVFLTLMSLCFETWPSKAVLLHTPLFWVACVYMGLFSTAIAWIIYYHLIREWNAVRASAVMYVVPIMAILWDFVFFHNRPRWTEGLGIIIILFGIVLIQLPKKYRCLPKA